MPNVNGKKFPYTPAGMAAAKKAAAKKAKPNPTSKRRGVTRDLPRGGRKPGRMY